MVSYISLQRDFTHGEISPLLNTRTDKELYYKSAKELRNMVVLPQGSATRRFGTSYAAEFFAPIDKYKSAAFNYSEELSYLLIFTPEKILVYKAQSLIAVVVTPYLTEEVTELDFTQARNQMFVVHKNHPIKILSRDATVETTWTFVDAAFRYLPTWDFRSDYFNTQFELLKVGAGESTDLTSVSDPVFSADHVGGLFLGYGDLTAGSELGRARITAYSNPTKVTVTIQTQFSGQFLAASGGVLGSECVLQEPIWSASRGYPNAATFYSARLVLASTKLLPEVMVMSVPNDYLDFDEGDGEADDAIVAQIASNEIATILYVVGDTNLQIFTVSGEYASRELEAGFELGNFVIRKQPGSNGSQRIKPVSFDDSTIYIRRGGQAVMAFSYLNDNNSYNSSNISLISAHLIDNPVSMDRRVRSTRDDADFLFVVNDDGTMAILQAVVAQKVLAWSLADTVNNTNGKFRRVVNVGDDVYFLVERSINGGIQHYIEKLDFDVYTDSSITFDFAVPTKTINGLDHLEGIEVRIVGDGYVLKSQTVSSGSVTLDEKEPEISHAVVGLNVIPKLTTNALVPPPNPSDLTFIEKRLLKIFVEYYESAGIYVEGRMIPEREFNNNFDYPPLPTESGNSKIDFMGEWDKRPTISITQHDPLPMTIIGIGYELFMG